MPTSITPSDELLCKREDCWETLDAAEIAVLETYCSGYLEFLSKAKTEREAHDLAIELLAADGFRDLDALPEGEVLAPGAKVYRSCRGKTLLAAVVGKQGVASGLHIVGGHTDAPRLDAKPTPLYEDGGVALFDTHYYGGIKKYQWTALPLALHGVVVKSNGETVKVCIGECPEDPVLVITDLLPHLGKEQAEKKLSEGITGEGLNVLVGSRPSDCEEDKEGKDKVKLAILRWLEKEYGIDEKDFASAELEIVPAGPARELGLDRSMLLGYGHDDRICAYAGLRGLLDLEDTPDFTSMVLLCDKEEIGSVGATGMDSVFFENSVAELLAATGEYENGLVLRRCLEKSRMLSADVNALHDPNYPEVSSPNNMAKINAGVVISKYTGARGKSGSSDASAEFMAEMRRIFDGNQVAWQVSELGKVDAGGGGTIAYLMARYGMDVVDCGVGLFSMHAPWEAAGKFDTYMAYKGYRAFFADARG